ADGPVAQSPLGAGLFSITIGLPQRAESLSDIMWAAASVALPAPNGRMNLTGRCGQPCADAAVAKAPSKPASAAATANAAKLRPAIRRTKTWRRCIGVSPFIGRSLQ